MKTLMLTAAVGLALTSQADAQKCAATCAPAAQACAPAAQACAPAPQACPAPAKKTIKVVEYHQEEQERTIKWLEWVNKPEKKSRDVTTYKQVRKTRDETYTVMKPTWKEVSREYTVCVPTIETKTGTRPIRKAVFKDVEQTYTVNETHMETQKQTFMAWKLVPVKQTRTVCEDQGKWVEKRIEVACQATPACQTTCQTGCNACAPAPQTIAHIQRVWEPNIVKKEVEFTCNQWQQVEEEREIQVAICKPVEKTRMIRTCNWVTEEEEFEYQVTVMKEETKTATEKVCEWVEEEMTRTVAYMECVPETKTVEFTVDNWVQIEKEKTITEMVCVPKIVEKEVDACQPASGCNACVARQQPRQTQPNLLAGLFGLSN